MFGRNSKFGKIIFYTGILLLTGSTVFGKSSIDVAALSDDELLSNLHDQFLLTEDLLSEFDRKVQQGVSVLQLIQSNPGKENLYAKLLSLRALHESLTEEFEARLQRRALNESLPPPGQGAGLEGWVKFRVGGLKQRSPRDSESLDFAVRDLVTAARKMDRTKSGLNLESMDAPEDLNSFRVWRAGYRKKARNSRTLRVNPVIRQWVQEEGAGSQEHLFHGLELEETSRFQALRIFPSVNSSGNLTGSGFPDGTWSITFDDGPGATTPEVIRNLKTLDLKASFFVLSSQVKKSSALASVALHEMQDGHDVFSHSFNHLQIPKLTPEARKHEIEGAVEVLEAVTGLRPKFFRLPYGAGVSLKAVRQDIMKSCMVHVFWNVDTLDWHDKDPDAIVTRTRAQIRSQKHGIILFHDIHRQSVLASERIMRELKSDARNRILPISEIVDEQNAHEAWSCQRGW
jgi:peptidoglycan/xylan/chitin deacetylase (PgdA/CDA1 family)